MFVREQLDLRSFEKTDLTSNNLNRNPESCKLCGAGATNDHETLLLSSRCTLAQ